MTPLAATEATRSKLATALTNLVRSIGKIHIGTPAQFPYGWRKAAKGRTVWRILEELINQNLEKHHAAHGIQTFVPSASEVSVFDFVIKLAGDTRPVYVNIKSGVVGSRPSKDDISKASGLLEFYDQDPNRELFVATFALQFVDADMSIEIDTVYVLPTAWLPDIYVNPSNNGNLQSAYYKQVETAVKRSNAEFIRELRAAASLAQKKRDGKRSAA